MKHFAFKSPLIALVLLLSAAACTKDPAEQPAPGIPPQQRLPNPLPAHARVREIKRTETDHQTFYYNNRRQVSQVRSQWQFDESDPTQIRTIVYDFQYDEQDRPFQVQTSDGFFANYFYHDTLVERTKEFFPGGALFNEVTYIYNNSRIIQQIWRRANLPGEPTSVFKYTFNYDSKGNLAKVEKFELVDASGPATRYELLETTEYSDFDDKINPTSWMLFYPYLPQVRYQYNNPRREVRKQVGVAPIVTDYRYEYSAAGLPVVVHTTIGGETATKQYKY
jgi:hypothetical protein